MSTSNQRRNQETGKPWHERLTPFAILELLRFRNRYREENLHNPNELPPLKEKRPDPLAVAPDHRTPDGFGNDPQQPDMGRTGMRFGRNFELKHTYPDLENLMNPNPRTVSRELLTRGEKMTEVPILNMFAAAWIQFMVHGWVAHRPPEGEKKPERVTVEIEDKDDQWPEHQPDPEPGAWVYDKPELHRPMQFSKTPADPSRKPDTDDAPPTFINSVSHWWDGSQIYGAHEQRLADLRVGSGGKLKVDKEHPDHLQLDPKLPGQRKGELGIDLTGFNDNYWIGLSLLHTLFTREHNHICEELAKRHPEHAGDDEWLFNKARLINTAIIAKIHTIEWTPGILSTKALDIAMHGNWYGVKRDKRLFYRVMGWLVNYVYYPVLKRISRRTYNKNYANWLEAYNGIPETEADHHAAEYSLTEEFVSVYRLHALVPDEFIIYSAKTDGQPIATRNFYEVSGRRTRTVTHEFPMDDWMYSFGKMHPGAIQLFNFPRFLQNMARDNGERFDLGAIDIYRDRERGVPRYNKFRELLGMPRRNTFEEITNNPEWAKKLREVYNNDVDLVDLMIGMYAEPPPKGFGFSDTAFRIFILMASRRLKSDRFFTTDYNAQTYTEWGLVHIDKTTMKSVIGRHFPSLSAKIPSNAFTPWK